jgi:hypothetical protein
MKSPGLFLRTLRPFLMLGFGCALILAGCGGTSSKPPPAAVAPTLSLNFPASLTGGTTTVASVSPARAPLAASGPTCSYAGANASDPFVNGYVMTKWLVASVASWTCLADTIVHAATAVVLAGIVPSDGTYFPATNPQPGDPTGFSILVDPATGKWTVKLFWQGITNQTGNPGLYISWQGADPGFSGKLIVDVANWTGTPVASNPAFLRMDFVFNAATKATDLYLAWPGADADTLTGSPWIRGFRVHAVETLSDGSFVVQGYMDLKRQFDTSFNYGGSPVFLVNTVSDSAGNGAANASLVDLGVHLDINGALDDLGHFRFTKTDTYYFSSLGAPQYINKTVTAATSFGDRIVTSFTNAVIDTALNLTAPDNTANCMLNSPVTACPTLLNSIFTLAMVPGMELNYGTNPNDARTTQLQGLTNLPTAHPQDSLANWAGAFAESF